MPSAPQFNHRRAQDFYPTPNEVISGLLSLLRFCPMFDLTIDPGAGPDGRIGRAILDAGLTRHLELVDLQASDPAIPSDPRVTIAQGDAISFLAGHPPVAGPTLIAMNPPFSSAFEFVRAGCALGAKNPSPSAVAMLMPLSFLGGACRASWFQGNPPALVAVINPRPSFSGNGRTDSSVYAWAIWHNSAATNATWPVGWRWLYCAKPTSRRRPRRRAITVG